MSRLKYLSPALFIVFILVLGLALPAQAQNDPPASGPPPLVLFTPFPSEVVDLSEPLSFDLTLRSGVDSELVDLSLQNLPDGWTGSFRGGGHIVSSVYVVPDSDTTVQLHLEAPASLKAGTYDFTVVADGNNHVEADLPMSLTFEERAPASLDASVDLPTVRGKPDTTFRYNLSLQNTGDDAIQVNLAAETPQYLTATFKSASQEVSSIPIDAHQTKRISVEVTSLIRGLPAGDYPVNVTATSDNLSAETTLVAEVVGQPDLLVTTPDGRLSGSAQLGKKTAITLVLANQGSAPASGIQLNATKPSGWTVDFSPDSVDEIQPGQQIEVTANIQPADKAIAGDYQLTFRATPQDSTQESVDYRVTVQTSTLWGIVGVALIAVAVLVIGLSVQRFGRR